MTQRTKNILVMWGDDFSHANNASFDILAKTIELMDQYHRKEHPDESYELKFSTMTQYFDSVKAEAE